MPDEMDEIIAEFVIEAEESLDKIDPLFVELETKGHDKDILNEIFRSMHTIKGAAGFLGLQLIVDVAHSSENIMKKLRENEIVLTKPLMDVILKSVDMLRILLSHVKMKDEKQTDTSALLKELEDALKNAQSQYTEDRIQDTGQKIESTAKENTEGMISPEQLVTSDNPPTPPFIKGEQVGITEQSAPSEAQEISQSASEKENIHFGRKESLQTLRVDVTRIDKTMDLTGEIVLVRNRLLNIVNHLEKKYSDDPYVASLFETVSFLDLVTSDMQLAVMRMRMQPIQKVFSRFPRLVRDLSASLHKEVDLRISGEDTEVDKSVIEQIGDPMVHIIRNAIDHGLESTEERRAKGKPEKGTIAIIAYQKGNQIVIEVSDDGKGIDLDRVKRKAVEKTLITEDESLRMTDEAATNLIFLPGFSTVDNATELSGRGVGMDVVKTNISKLNGYIEVITRKNMGTTFKISIPLTLAIIHSLMVRAGNSLYAIPLSPIEETLRVSRKDITDVVGQKVMVIRGKVHPLFELSSILGNGNGTSMNSDYRYAVVVTIADKRFCIGVDELLGQEEVVIKAVDGIDTSSSYILGATITGDGKIVLILDLASMSRNVLSAVRS